MNCPFSGVSYLSVTPRRIPRTVIRAELPSPSLTTLGSAGGTGGALVRGAVTVCAGGVAMIVFTTVIGAGGAAELVGTLATTEVLTIVSSTPAWLKFGSDVACGTPQAARPIPAAMTTAGRTRMHGL